MNIPEDNGWPEGQDSSPPERWRPTKAQMAGGCAGPLLMLLYLIGYGWVFRASAEGGLHSLLRVAYVVVFAAVVALLYRATDLDRVVVPGCTALALLSLGTFPDLRHASRVASWLQASCGCAGVLWGLVEARRWKVWFPDPVRMLFGFATGGLLSGALAFGIGWKGLSAAGVTLIGIQTAASAVVLTYLVRRRADWDRLRQGFWRICPPWDA